MPHLPAPKNYPPHPRTIGWLGTTALAMGGSNQSLFLIAALFVGQGDIAGQGSAAVPLLMVGLLLSWAAAPGWTELIMMWPNRVGGIAATCGEAFRPYAPVLGNLAGTCYWWGWVPTCGLTAIFSASAIHEWYLPGIPVNVLACALVLFFMGLNLSGIAYVTRLVVPVGIASAVLAFLSGLLPILSGNVDWRQATDFHLTTPFDGYFGQITSLMAGLYLIGFAAPAFEAAACHVGETVDPKRNVPRAMFMSGAMAAVYFILLPLVWLGTLGSEPLGKDLALVLGPTFAPLFGSAAKAAAIWFMMLNMFHGTVQPLAGASRTLSQLAEDGLVPRILAVRSRNDTPWVATVLTAGMAIFFLLLGDPIWLVAAANFTYLIGICLPSVAVWLLRKDAPHMERPYRAPQGAILLGLSAAGVWLISAILGFQQFGLPTVLFGLVFAYSGAALYAIRKYQDRRAQGLPGLHGSLHIKLTGAMLAVLVLDGAGYLLAVQSVPSHHGALVVALEDIFVAVAILTISVGLILPGMIAHSAVQVSEAAAKLTHGTVADFSRAMQALSQSDLERAHARIDVTPVQVHSNDELGDMAKSFNLLQEEIAVAARGIDGAREGLRDAQTRLHATNLQLEQRITELDGALEQQRQTEEALRVSKHVAEEANRAKSRFLANMSHEIRTPLNGVLGMSEILLQGTLDETQQQHALTIHDSAQSLIGIINDILDFSKVEAGKLSIDQDEVVLRSLLEDMMQAFRPAAMQKGLALQLHIGERVPEVVVTDALRLRQMLTNLVGNAIKFTGQGQVSVKVEVAQPDRTIAPSLAAVLRFEVQDTGMGIPAQTLPHLFTPFTQADSSSTRKYGGTGLGLAITRELITLLGGDIGATSQPGKGSTFWFHLPVPIPEAPMATSQSRRTPAMGETRLQGHVLLAEDNPVNQKVAIAFLKSIGCTVTSVSNGREALEAFTRDPFDLILMDCQMPEMDGFESTARIRNVEVSGMRDAGNGNARVPIVALTANAMRGDRERCLAAGMDDYLSKPFTRAQLEAVIGNYIGTNADASRQIAPVIQASDQSVPASDLAS